MADIKGYNMPDELYYHEEHSWARVDGTKVTVGMTDFFQKEAARVGIEFTHVIKFSEVDEAIEDVCKELGEVAFVVSESPEQQVDSRIEQGERLQQKLFVYSVV